MQAGQVGCGPHAAPSPFDLASMMTVWLYGTAG